MKLSPLLVSSLAALSVGQLTTFTTVTETPIAQAPAPAPVLPAPVSASPIMPPMGTPLTPPPVPPPAVSPLSPSGAGGSSGGGAGGSAGGGMMGGKSCYVGYTYCGSVLLEHQGFTVSDLSQAVSMSPPSGPLPANLSNALFVCQPSPNETDSGSAPVPQPTTGLGCSTVSQAISFICGCGNLTVAPGGPVGQGSNMACQNIVPHHIAWCGCEA